MGDFLLELGQKPQAVRGTKSDKHTVVDPKMRMTVKERLQLENQKKWERLKEVEQRRLKNLALLNSKSSDSSDSCTVMGGRTRRNKKARRKGITRRNKKPRRKGITRRNRIYRK